MSDSYPPVVFGHRGASRVFRENTIEAFIGAATLGADGVELDVRITADGEAVVHHDPTVPDTDLVIAEVPRSALPDWVPTLAAALTACERPSARTGRSLTVNVEIKSSPEEPGYDPDHRAVPGIVAVVAAHLPPDRVLISSFDPRALAAVRSVDPTLATALLSFDLRDLDRVLDLAVQGGHRAVNPWDGFVTPALMAGARERGLAVYPWTVDDPARMAELVALGVDGIITNVPDVCAAVVDRGDDD